MTVGVDAVLFPIENSLFDIEIDEDGDIRSEDFFDTAIIVSLFCDRRAKPEDVPDSSRRRGWIGNEATPGFEIGSHLWLYEQPRMNGETFRGMEVATNQCLQWLVDDGYAIDIESNVEVTSSNSIIMHVKITRPDSHVEERHYKLWDNTGA